MSKADAVGQRWPRFKGPIVASISAPAVPFVHAEVTGWGHDWAGPWRLMFGTWCRPRYRWMVEITEEWRSLDGAS